MRRRDEKLGGYENVVRIRTKCRFSFFFFFFFLGERQITLFFQFCPNCVRKISIIWGFLKCKSVALEFGFGFGGPKPKISESFPTRIFNENNTVGIFVKFSIGKLRFCIAPIFAMSELDTHIMLTLVPIHPEENVSEHA